METKICRKCEIEKENNSDNYYKYSRNEDGLDRICKECVDLAIYGPKKKCLSTTLAQRL